ncbi:MAG TPA: hypothetical protein VF576_11960 [Rubricoccaceae bacterium]
MSLPRPAPRATPGALALLAAGLVAGCGLLTGDDDAFMVRLDGAWELARYEERRILDDGTVTVETDLEDAGTFTFAATVRCPNTGFMLDGGDTSSRAYTFEGNAGVHVPNTTGGCGIVVADGQAQRVTFIEGARFSDDVMLTVDTDGGGDQVWSRYQLFEADGYVLHTRYTLRRQG